MVSLVRSTSVCWISFAPVFFCVILSYIIVLSPTLVIFHANQASMCLGPLRIKGEVSTIKHVYDLKYFLLTVPRWCFFCGSFLLFMFHVLSLLY